MYSASTRPQHAGGEQHHHQMTFISLYQLLDTLDLDIPSSTNLTAVTHPSAVSPMSMKQFQGMTPCSMASQVCFFRSRQALLLFLPTSSPLSSEPGSPDRQAELKNLTPPPSYAVTIASKLAIHNPNLPATLPVISPNIQPVRYKKE